MRTYSVLFLSLVTAGPALAQTAERQALEGVARCAAMSESSQRLSCYDAASLRVKDTLSAPAAAPSRAPAREDSSWFGFNVPDILNGSQQAQKTAQQFGSDMLSQDQRAVIATSTTGAAVPSEPIQQISARVMSYELGLRGNYILTLDNGQVWRQLEGDGGQMQLRKTGTNVVNISRGFWDSYNLKLNGGSAIYKVVRVK